MQKTKKQPLTEVSPFGWFREPNSSSYTERHLVATASILLSFDRTQSLFVYFLYSMSRFQGFTMSFKTPNLRAI